MVKVHVKVLAALIGVAVLLLQGCSSSPSGSDQYKYTMHDVEVINANARDVEHLHLQMVGSEECLDVASVTKGEESYRMTFSLPVPEDRIPESWGDVHGTYTQHGVLQFIEIYNYEYNLCEKITIEIQGESYKVAFSN